MGVSRAFNGSWEFEWNYRVQKDIGWGGRLWRYLVAQIELYFLFFPFFFLLFKEFHSTFVSKEKFKHC